MLTVVSYHYDNNPTKQELHWLHFADEENEV